MIPITGAAGVAGCELIVAIDPVDMHPDEFLAVIVYVPATTKLNMPVVFV